MQLTATFLLAATMATSALAVAIAPRQVDAGADATVTVTVTVYESAATATGDSLLGTNVQVPASLPTLALPVSLGALGGLLGGHSLSAPAVSTPSVSVPSIPIPSVTLDKTPAAALPSAVQVQDTNQVVNVINDVKNQSADLDQLIAPLSLSPASLAQAPAIAAQLPVKLAALAKTAADGVTTLTSIDGAISGANSDTIVTALTDFVKVHQNLLKTISGKHGVIAKFGFAEPVRVALVQLERVVDAFAIALINVIPSKMSQGQTAKAMLDASLNSSISVYSS